MTKKEMLKLLEDLNKLTDVKVQETKEMYWMGFRSAISFVKNHFLGNEKVYIK